MNAKVGPGDVYNLGYHSPGGIAYHTLGPRNRPTVTTRARLKGGLQIATQRSTDGPWILKRLPSKVNGYTKTKRVL